jgi:hypothetical protein
MTLLIFESSVGAWQVQPSLQGQGPALNKQPGYSSTPAPVAQPQPYPRPDAQATGRQTLPETGAHQAVDPDMPCYPYPKYHNPYYDGTQPGSVMSDVLQWLMELPSGVMEKFSNLMDSRFFPAKPATDGGHTR